MPTATEKRSKHGRKSEEIYHILRNMISKGELHHGQQLPSERALEKRYHVSRATISKALTRMTS
jgi:DNA-binding GntR family transcriptional regulator